MHGLDLTAEMVLRAYSMGAFAMGESDDTVNWYRPDQRCIIELNHFHAAKRLLRTYRQQQFQIRVNWAFDQVIAECAAPDSLAHTTGDTTADDSTAQSSTRSSTWISKDIIRVYSELFQLGFAHSVEAYAEEQLVGGLYGVAIGGVFMGESMFHRSRDASKVCLLYLIERLKLRNYQLLDCQYLTSHLKTFGAIEIDNENYIARLHQALALECIFN